MKVFVTGASGFVGGAVARTFGAEHEIRAMARSASAAAAVAALGATPVAASLATVTPAHLVGCDVVVHCAAETAEWAPDRVYRDTNAVGTLRLVDAARSAGVRRFVHISSDSGMFDGRPLRNIDERAPLATASPFPYARSKAVAETIIARAGDPAVGFDTVVVRPVLVWGPGDRSVLPQLVDMANRNAFVWLSGGRTNLSTTYIDNLVHGIGLAVERGRAGDAYFVVDRETHVLRAFLSRYAEAAGVTLPNRSVPAPLARGAARLIEGGWRVLAPDRHPPVTRFATATLSRHVTVASTKARDVLGYVPQVDFDTGIAAVART